MSALVIVPSKFSICYNRLDKADKEKAVIVPSKFSICYNDVFMVWCCKTL